MAPKKKQQVQKMDLSTFLTDEKLGSWADEMEDMPVYSRTGYGTSNERRTFNANTNTYGTGSGGYSVREELPLPTRPPFTVHLGNLSFDATVAEVTEFFTGCDCTNVRIIEDKEQMKPKGFGYVEFATLDGLKKALTLTGTPFQGRNVRISVADPPKQSDRPEARELNDWTRKGPLPDLPSRQGGRNTSGRGFNDDMGGRREYQQPADDGKVRDFGDWSRKGPLPSLPQPDRPSYSREGGRSRENNRGENFGDRRNSPAAWGEGRRSQEGSRPPRREFQERPHVERAPTAAEQDNQWRAKMRPDPPANLSTASSREGSEAPTSPAITQAAPAGRPRLNLAKRTVSEIVPDQPSPSLTGDAKASPFGAARPIDTAAKEREIEEKRQAALREKKEAEEAAKEEKKRLAKEAAAQAEKEKEEAAANADANADSNGSAAQEPEKVEGEAIAVTGTETANGAAAAPAPAPADESKTSAPNTQEAPKSRADTASSWRRGSGGPPSGPANEGRGGYRGGRGGYRGGRGNDRHYDRNDRNNFDRQNSRGPKGNGPPAPVQEAAPVAEAQAGPDEDGWSTVQKPNKNKRGGAPRGTS